MGKDYNSLYRSIRYALAVSLWGSSVVAAQTNEWIEKPVELERIEVTGSRIKRADIEGASPILVLQRKDIEATGHTAIGDVLQDLPLAGSALNTNVNNSGDGSIRLDLRNLGESRVLVLVNGRRWISMPNLNAVDLQTIPTALIERIEVLKDGASAIYGSDAIAGVVNIVTRKDFTGAQANAYYGQWEQGDGETIQADFSIGATGERAQVFMNASYREQDAVMAADRAISKEPVFGTGNQFGSLATPAGFFFFVDPEDGSRPILTFDNTESFPEGAPLSEFRPYDFLTDNYNFAPDNFLLTPSERYGLYASGRYTVSDRVDFFSDVLFNKRESSVRQASTPLGIQGSEGIFIPADNPFNPFGFTFGPTGGGTRFAIARRMLEAGPRVFSRDVRTYQFTGGFDGDLDFGGRYWEWEAYYQFAKTDESRVTTGLINKARLQETLLADCDPCLNLFGGAGGFTVEEVMTSGSGTISQESIDFITFVALDQFAAERNLYAANLSGFPVDLPAGPLGVAVGFEYRRDKGFDQPDSLIALGATSGNVRRPTSGSFSVDEAYVEFAVPILSDVPGAKTLELSLASRHSDYDTFGSTSNSKAGLRWQPYSELLLRGTWSEGFRAPSINELFQGLSSTFPELVDPCSDMFALAPGMPGGRNEPQPQNVIDNCIADGVLADGSYRQFGRQERITVGGNPNVEPETSKSTTLGLVYSPRFVSELDITLDYYDIEIEDTISRLGPQAIVDGCYFGGFDALCELVERNPEFGGIDDLLDVFTNLGRTKASGLDIGLDYSFPETPAGFFELNWDSSYVEEFVDVIPVGGGELRAIDRVGFNEGDEAFPRWKSNLYLNWSYGDWAGVYGLRYIHHQDEICPRAEFVRLGLCTDPDHPEGPRNHLESVAYHDSQVSYHYRPWDSRFTIGARNLFDKDPPICFTCFANSYDPTTYDMPGRFLYLRVTTNF